MRVLFIDNDVSSQLVYAEICREAGIDYSSVNNPVNLGEVIYNSAYFDVIIVDLEMPHRNGYDVLRILRSLPVYRVLPIVACTVHTSEIERVRDAGFSSLIIKPISIDRFPDQLNAILSGETIWENHSSNT